jgi:hypothetical protein
LPDRRKASSVGFGDSVLGRRCRVFWSSFIALGLYLVWLLLGRLRAAPPGARVTLLPLAIAVVFTLSESIVQRIVWLGGWWSLRESERPFGMADRKHHGAEAPRRPRDVRLHAAAEPRAVAAFCFAGKQPITG